MKTAPRALALFAVALLALSALGQNAAPPSPPDDQKARLARMEEDMREMVDEVMRVTYPALVFVKPIQKTFEMGEEQQRQIFGSGAIISADGYVVTNNHVAEKATQITCVLTDEREIAAEIVGLDRDTDVALLKLDAKEIKAPLPFITFGDSDKLLVGQTVMALGCPLGYEHSVTRGIVSNKKRYLEGADYNLWIQTDAAINPGNSGGPLVNTKGEIIGINTLKASWGDNVGFSIPSNIVRDVVDSLKANKRVLRAWTGIRIQALKDFTKSSTIKATEGCLVAGTEPHSPAEKAGLVAGDIILTCNGEKLNVVLPQEIPAAKRFFAALPIGAPVTLKVDRKGEAKEFSLTPEEKGKEEGDDYECKEWGLTVKEISKFSPTTISFFRKTGAFVFGIKGGGNAESSRFFPGDIIVTINGTEIDSLETLKKTYETENKKEIGKRKCLFELIRQGYPKYLVLDFNTKSVESRDEKKGN